jgi:hypothetical protein
MLGERSNPGGLVPVDYRVDPERRVVFTRGYGVLTDYDVFTYQREVWSREDVAGFDEVWDVTAVEKIALPHPDRVGDLAALGASMDAPHTSSRLAIVAPADFAFGLGRMYEVLRHADPKSRKEVMVFRARPEALRWLGLTEDPQAGAVSEGS